MSPAAGDSVLEKQGPAAGALHLRVVVAFDGQQGDAAEFVDQVRRDIAQIGCVTDSCFAMFQQKCVRTLGIVRQVNGADRGIRRWLKFFGVEGVNQGSDLITAGYSPQVVNTGSGAKDGNLLANQRGYPAEVEVIAVKVRQTNGANFTDFDADSAQPGGGGAGADAGVDEKNAGWRSDRRAVS